MKLSQLLIAGTALVSASAIAGGNQAKQGMPSDQQTQHSSQAAQESKSQPQDSRQQASQSPEIIKKAQEKLSGQGHDAGQADGKLGAKTQAALKEFQKSKGLQASGQLDTQTLAALDVSGTQGSASTGASAGGSATSREQSASASPSAGSSPRAAEPKAQEQPKEKSKY